MTMVYPDSIAVEIVTAVYEKGMLRPLQPLSLRERQRVRIR